MDGLPRAATAALALALAALALGGCLGGEERSSRIKGKSVVVYSSLPRSGASAPAARAVAAGERAALADAGGRAGDLEVRLVELDSADPEGSPWSPERVDANAEQAADDPKAIAYLGELDLGASAVSLPITNDAGLLQVSPTDTLTSLTQTPIGRPRAGPDRYYPSGSRSFARLVPNDELLAETLLGLARGEGVQRMSVLFDSDIHSRELAGQLAALGRRDGPEPARVEEYRGRVDEIPDVVRSLAEARPDLVVYAGVAGAGTGRLLAQIDARMPGVPVFCTAGLLARDPRAPVPVAPARVQALGAMPPRFALPAGGRRLLERLTRSVGSEAARPEALYGYEAMNVVLDAIRAGGPDRTRVRRAGTHIRTRNSPLGPYLLRGTGDVNTQRFALWTLREGRFEFTHMVE
jgi:branched-chain amino acid transport system substrate-binding protein